MKKLLLILCFGIVLANCNSSPVEKPKDLIDKDMMVDILYDLYLTNALNSTDSKYLLDKGITPAKYIYGKYNVDSLQFSRSDRYYAADIDAYEKMYKSVTLKLQKEKEVIDTLISKELKSDLNDDELESNNLPSKNLRDSLANKRLQRKKDFKNSIKN